MIWLRRVGLALVAGLLLGVASRVVMRVIGLLSGGVEGFSWGGTIEIVLFGILIGAPIALFFLALRSHLDWRRPWAGVALGVALFAATALNPPPSAASAMAGTADPPLATAALFAALWLGFGLLLEYLHGLTTPHINKDGSSGT